MSTVTRAIRVRCTRREVSPQGARCNCGPHAIESVARALWLPTDDPRLVAPFIVRPARRDAPPAPSKVGQPRSLTCLVWGLTDYSFGRTAATVRVLGTILDCLGAALEAQLVPAAWLVLASDSIEGIIAARDIAAARYGSPGGLGRPRVGFMGLPFARKQELAALVRHCRRAREQQSMLTTGTEHVSILSCCGAMHAGAVQAIFETTPFRWCRRRDLSAEDCVLLERRNAQAVDFTQFPYAVGDWNTPTKGSDDDRNKAVDDTLHALTVGLSIAMRNLC